jgi:rhomboid family GlyGly-CTERM serine protease
VSRSWRCLVSCALFILCLGVLQLFTEALLLDRGYLWAGESWRLWTGHFVHVNAQHLALNTVASLIIYLSITDKVSAAEIFICGVTLAPILSVMLLYWHPEIIWYSGLSGLLHALVSYFSLRMISAGERVFGWVLVSVWAKVFAELIRTKLGYENFLGEMLVITEAHFMGALIGTIAAILHWVHWLTPAVGETRKKNALKPLHQELPDANNR